MLNLETLKRLILTYKDDTDVKAFLQDALNSFEDYHLSIFRMETKLMMVAVSDMDRPDYQDLITSLDKARTGSHDNVISTVSVLNRMAEQQKLPPVYDGIVSKERPYRKQVANAVLAFVESIIQNRR